jgi:hypothetical protein
MFQPKSTTGTAGDILLLAGAALLNMAVCSSKITMHMWRARLLKTSPYTVANRICMPLVNVRCGAIAVPTCHVSSVPIVEDQPVIEEHRMPEGSWCGPPEYGCLLE